MKRKLLKFLSFSLVLTAITALVLTMASCKKKDDTPPGEDAPEISFTCEVVLADGKSETLEYTCKKGQSVGEVMLAAGDIEGEDGAYGLYVKCVRGQEYDYEKDGIYWAFYVGDTLSVTGVEKTKAEDGARYAFKAEKG